MPLAVDSRLKEVLKLHPTGPSQNTNNCCNCSLGNVNRTELMSKPASEGVQNRKPPIWAGSVLTA